MATNGDETAQSPTRSPGSLRCLDPSHQKEKFNDENVETVTSEEQVKVEELVEAQFEYLKNVIDIDPEHPQLFRDKHATFLKKGLITLPQSYECLDASRAWICYWILHSLELLDEPINEDLKSRLAQFLNKCQHPTGGFGGGPGQEPHLAPTYAAVNALCILGTEEAFQVINREKLQEYLFRMRTPDGAFRMHDDGEVDVRGVYCALSVARLTNIYTAELFEGTYEWILRCQTYEGGFGGVPGMEAHGGYTFCGFAGLVLLEKEQMCDTKSLLRWCVNRQMRFEGGFQGRTNKLVDGCYSFWQGGLFPLIHRTLCQTESSTLSLEHWLFDQGALQEYLLTSCQSTTGGLIDKPGKNKDFYHTCYTLSGLSVAQHFAGGNVGNRFIIGDPKNELCPTHPVFNICVDKAIAAVQYYQKLPVPNHTAPPKKEKGKNSSSAEDFMASPDGD